jgi:hypothetical protein
MECTCPFCPLVKANVQICNYEVCIGHDKQTDTYHIGIAASNPDMGALTNHLTTLALIARNNYKVKPGESVHKEKPGEFEFTVFRKSKCQFTVCFHTEYEPAPIHR